LIKEALAKRAAQLGAAAPTNYGAPEKEDDDADDERFQDPENEVGLFAGGAYDKDDDKADRIYQEVDEKMDRRRRARRLVSPDSIVLLHPSPFLSLVPLLATWSHAWFIIVSGIGCTDYRRDFVSKPQGSSRTERT
jgi:carbamate kinase